MPSPRGTRRRTFTLSGGEPAKVPSRARPHKPPAKVIAARKAAALSTGGGRLPPRVRKELAREPTPRRTRPPGPANPPSGRTRAGKREPNAARWAEAGELRDAQPSRRAGNRAPDPGARRLKEAREASRPH